MRGKCFTSPHITHYQGIYRVTSITAENHKHRQKYPVLKGTQIINPYLTLMEDFFLAVFIQELLNLQKNLTEILQKYPVHNINKI